MASTRPVRRPTESAALTAAGRSARPTPPTHLILADLATAHRTEDRYGTRLCAHLLVRATAALEVGES